MNNIFSYLPWRGDLTLTQSRFNEVDNLILSTLSYLDFSGIVPKNGEQEITIQRAAEEYFSLHGIPKHPDLEKASSLELREWMLYLMTDTRRFRNMRLSCLVQILDTEQVKQFSAMTILVSRKQLYLSFRGTSDVLTGWKEDFLMACMPEVPSQEEAVLYTERVAEQYPNHRLLLGGHSKGGNLAVYAAVQASPEIQSRIDIVWSNDGPGFQEAFLRSEAYQALSPKIRSIVPKSSVVGMLLAHPENYIFRNANFHKAFRVTLLWLASALIVHIPFGLLLSLMLNRRPHGWKFLRVMYFIPNVISTTAVAFMWYFTAAWPNIWSPCGAIILNCFTGMAAERGIHWIMDAGAGATLRGSYPAMSM